LLNGSIEVEDGNIGVVNLGNTEVLKAGALRESVLRVDVLRVAHMWLLLVVIFGMAVGTTQA